MKKIVLLLWLCMVSQLLAADMKIVPLSDIKAKEQYLALMDDPAPDNSKELSWKMYVVMKLKMSFHGGDGAYLVSLTPNGGYYGVISAADWNNASSESPKILDSFVMQGHFMKRGPYWVNNKEIKLLYLAPEQLVLNPPVLAPSATDKDNVESKAYVDRIVPLICAQWDSAALMNEASFGFLNNKKEPENSKSNFEKFKQDLGNMSTYEGCEGGTETVLERGVGPKLFANYLAHLVFQKGKAVLELQLIHQNDRWKISRYYVREN
jgi:hypothetical protein